MSITPGPKAGRTRELAELRNSADSHRVRGVRCRLCWNVESARLARAHNDANVLSLGQRLVPAEDLIDG